MKKFKARHNHFEDVFLGGMGGGFIIYVFNITYTTCKRIKTLRLKITQGKDSLRDYISNDIHVFI